MSILRVSSGVRHPAAVFFRICAQVLFLLLLNQSVQAAERLRFATLAPADSPWGQEFSEWGAKVFDRGRGALQLDWSFGSRLDEPALVERMRAGDLDGAFLSSVGLSQIRGEFLVLRTPGLFDGWHTLDRVRDALSADFAAMLAEEGFHLIAWGDVGLIHLMSKGRAIRTPAELAAARVITLKQDRIAPLRAKILGYTPVAETIPGVMAALKSGEGNVISASALGASSLGWDTELDHVTDMVMGVRSGAIVVRSEALARLEPSLRALLLRTGLRAGKSLSKRVRGDDRRAIHQLGRKMTQVELSATHRGEWYEAWRTMRSELADGTFERPFFDRVRALAGVR